MASGYSMRNPRNSFSMETEIERLLRENICLAEAAARRWSGKFGENDALSIALEGLHKAAINSSPLVKNFRAYAKTAIERTFINRLKRIQAARRGGKTFHVSIDEPLAEGTGKIGDYIEDSTQPGAAVDVGDSEEYSRIRALAHQLPENERDMIYRRFGLGGDDPETLEEIGIAHGCGKSQAMRVVNRALAMLKRLYRPVPVRSNIVVRAPVQFRIRTRSPRRKRARISCRKVEYGPGMNGYSKFGLARGMYSRGGRLDAAKAAILNGFGNRETHRMTGMSKRTVAKLRGILERDHGIVSCPCGKPATHNGWCRVRYARSEKRQQFIKKWAA